MKNICKNCSCWNNKQSELEYSTFSGICTCHKWKFTTTNESDIALLDRDNLSNQYKGIQRYENQSKVVPVGKVERSRYCFITNEKFGCIHFDKK